MILIQIKIFSSNQKKDYFFFKKVPKYTFIFLRLAFQVVQQGVRPHIPDYCDESMRGFLQVCWHQDPNQRPMFDQVYNWLANYESKL